MEPKDYYYNQFRSDFAEFMAKSKMAHKHPGEGVYIPIQDLNESTMSHVKTDSWHTMRFLYCLAFTILIDQVMYTYFKNDYAKFQSITLYPKIEYGISNMNAKPWDIAQHAGGLTTFEKFADFFVQDFKDFFEKQDFPNANWAKVKETMLNDRDICFGNFGEIFCKILKKSL